MRFTTSCVTPFFCALFGSVAIAGAQTNIWSQSAPNTSPAARAGSAMAFDSVRQRAVLFGGVNQPSDTWEWDGLSWSQAMPVNAPPMRDYHAMAFDSVRQRIVLFGGTNINGGGYFADTWEWDGVSWIAAFSPTYPSPRVGHAMAFDAARQRVVMFGGFSLPNTYHNDTWLWDGTNWTPVSSLATPAPRSGMAMAFDSVRQKVVMFGGAVSNQGVCVSDTWEWDGANWTVVSSSSSPTPRSNAAMAFDSGRQRALLFGGWNSVVLSDDTWEWDGSNWTAAASPVGPTGRALAAMAFDSSRQEVVMFGGWSVGIAGGYYLGDTWVNGPAQQQALASSYGFGCGAPTLRLVPDANARPILGLSGAVTVVDAPTHAAWMIVGWSSQTFGPFVLPVTLAGIGMPGCDLLQSSEVTGLGMSPVTATTLSFSLSIPSQAVLVGSHIYLQSFAYAPGANAAQLVVSNGVDWLIGDV